MRIGNCDRWTAWAASLGRRGVVARRREVLALRWLRLRSALNTRISFNAASLFMQQLHFHAVSLNLRFTADQRLHLDVKRAMMPASAPATAGPAPRVDVLSRISHHTDHTASHRETSMRLATIRTERIEAHFGSRELVVARKVVHQPPERIEEFRRAPDAWMREPTAGLAWNSQPSAAAAVNVEQITENVIRQIDRRIGAWRERMGRI